MYLLEISIQSAALGIVVILGAGLVIVLGLVKSPREKKLGLFQGEAMLTEDAEATFIEHINQGNAALSLYEYDKALEHYQAALRLKGGEASVHFKIGRVFTNKEDYKNAITAYRNALNLQPGMLEAHFELVRIYQAQKNPELAHQELNHALTIKPDHEDVLKLKVKLHERAEEYEEALPYLRKLITVARPTIKFQIMLAEYLAFLGQAEEAIAEYRSLMEADRPNRLEYQGKIGQVYFEAGDYAQASEYFKTVLQDHILIKDQDYINAVKSQLAASLCNEGVRHFQADNAPAAINHYQEALLHDDANPDIHYNLGKALAHTSEAAKALKHFETAIALNPQDVSSYYEMAVLQDEKGMIREAQGNYEKILAMDARHFNATFGLGTLYGVQGDMDRAIQYLSAAVTINSEDVDAIYNLGVALEQSKDYKKAIKMYKKVLSLDASHEKARSNLAHIQHIKSH